MAGAAALVRPHSEGGAVVVVAEASLPTVQCLVRWDPVGAAEAELDSRAEVGLPPSVHIAALDGTSDGVSALLETAGLPGDLAGPMDVLGPVDLPLGARRPAGLDPDAEVIRMLVRVRRDQGLELASTLRRATGCSARRDHELVRVQVDPLHIG